MVLQRLGQSSNNSSTLMGTDAIQRKCVGDRSPQVARALTPTLLPLDRFAEILGLHPLHFNQVVLPNQAEGVNCVKEIYQYPWQKSDAVGREEIAQAIAGAESTIGRYLGYDPLMKWQAGDGGEGERIDWTDPLRNWHYQLRAKRGYMVSGGQEAKSLLDADAAITYSDTEIVR